MTGWRRHQRSLVILGLMALCTLAAASWLARPQLMFGSTSPGGGYRVDVFAASAWQRWQHPDHGQPGFARLYRLPANDLLDQSDVVDLMGNGEVRWMLASSGEVTVGLDIRFRGLARE